MLDVIQLRLLILAAWIITRMSMSTGVPIKVASLYIVTCIVSVRAISESSDK